MRGLLRGYHEHKNFASCLLSPTRRESTSQFTSARENFVKPLGPGTEVYRFTLDSVTSSLKLCDKHKFSQFAALSRIALGRAWAELDDAHEGVELIRQGMAEMLATRNRNGITAYLQWLSEAQMLGGEIREATESIDKAINEEPTHLFFRPENLRLRAALRLKQGNTELAEMGFRESIAVARRMGAKAWELRTTMSLARLLDLEGRRSEGRSMLAEIYGWFTEGFDTADLKEANLLLEELSGTGVRPA